MPPEFQQPRFGYPYWGPGMHHVLGLRGVLFLVFLIVLLVIALVALALSVSSRRRAHLGGRGGVGYVAGGEALAVLDERFARGDIDPTDYTTRRSLLTGTPSKE